MAGMVSTSMIDYHQESMVMDSGHGLLRDHTPKHGGCHYLRKHIPNLIRIMIELLVDGVKKV